MPKINFLSNFQHSPSAQIHPDLQVTRAPAAPRWDWASALHDSSLHPEKANRCGSPSVRGSWIESSGFKPVALI